MYREPVSHSQTTTLRLKWKINYFRYQPVKNPDILTEKFNFSSFNNNIVKQDPSLHHLKSRISKYLKKTPQILFSRSFQKVFTKYGNKTLFLGITFLFPYNPLTPRRRSSFLVNGRLEDMLSCTNTGWDCKDDPNSLNMTIWS